MTFQKRTVPANFRISHTIGVPLRFTLLFLFLSVTGAGASGAAGARVFTYPPGVHPKSPENSLYLPDRVIVKMAADPFASSPAGGAGIALKLNSTLQVRRSDMLFPSHSGPRWKADDELSRFFVVLYDAPVDPFVAAAELSAAPGVEFAEPWFIYPLFDAYSYVPNDSSFNLQWYIRTVYADSAWDISKGDSNVVIGFVDTGVQTDHPDLAANVWINPGEDGPDSLGGDRRMNGLDDDGNTKIDDWRGWDFGGADYLSPSEDNAPIPTAANNAHGTQTAGIACAVPDNNRGIAGAGFHTRILPVKATADNDTRGPGGSPYIIAGYQGIVYAAETGADIISLSWGGSGYSQAEQDWVNYAASLGAVIVAAAGNTGSAAELQYPASYDNVVSVAATQINADLKATYSSYNERVDVSAPGGEGSNLIYSTYYPGVYTYGSGTSMSTPLVAGVAALVRARFPSYTAAQIAEQVRVTCDDIYTANITYRYKLGKGRVNAYRALTESWPSVRMTNYYAKDSAGGNNNGAFEVNEDVDIRMDFTNYLDPTSSATTITLTSTDASVTVTSGVFLPGAIPTSGSVNNDAVPFRIHVEPGIAPQKIVTFTLGITDGSYSDRQQFTMLFNPTFATHTVNNVWTTLTNNGRIGFQDFPSNTQGVGVIFNGDNQLFEGGLLMGTSATKLVNVVRNPGAAQDADFTSALTYGMSGPGAVADEEGNTYFTDSTAPAANRLGVRVLMNSYAYASAPDDDYLITDYRITNVSGAPLSNFYAGLFMDWDVFSNSSAVNSGSYFDSNRTDFDAARAMEYAWYDTTGPTVYCGVVALEGAASYRALFNSITIDLSRAAKWGWISGGVVKDTSKGDIHSVISSGPYVIASGASQRVAFALVAGNGLADLLANADAAIARWTVIKTLTDVSTGAGEGVPGSFVLSQNFPNPFNPSTTIRYGLPERGNVRITVHSILGEKIRTLIGGGDQGAGYHEAVWDGTDDNGRNASSGVYFCRVEYSGPWYPVTGRLMKLLLLR
ncbi:MAG TPA: S8 family serine peptidase [Bacteroidota bacterium]|nr:S8 family serine peptidase [Bacteroidota bacterium]